MCEQPNSNLLFCTCKDNNSESDALGIKWTLKRHVDNVLMLSEEKSFSRKIAGMAKISQEMFRDGFSSNNVLQSLNNSQLQVFDFDYQPNEGDVLWLSDNRVQYKNMFFKYSGSKWAVYEAMFHGYIDMAEGKVAHVKEKDMSSKQPINKLWNEDDLIQKANEHIELENEWRKPRKLSFYKSILKILGFNT